MFPVIGVLLLVGLIGSTAPLHAQAPFKPVTSTILPAQPIEPTKPVELVQPVPAIEDDQPEEEVHYEQAIDHPRIREVSEKSEKIYRFYPLKGQIDADNSN